MPCAAEPDSRSLKNVKLSTDVSNMVSIDESIFLYRVRYHSVVAVAAVAVVVHSTWLPAVVPSTPVTTYPRLLDLPELQPPAAAVVEGAAIGNR